MDKKPIAAGKSSFNLIDARQLFSELNLREDSSLLDIACGSGAYSIAASEYIGSQGIIHAVDLWEDGIKLLQQNVNLKQIVNIQASVADISKCIPIEDHSIDICLMATVLHDLIEDKTDEGTMNELKRVLKETGTLAVIEFEKIDGPPGPPKTVRLSPEELAEYLHKHSFQSKKTLRIGPYNYFSAFTR